MINRILSGVAVVVLFIIYVPASILLGSICLEYISTGNYLAAAGTSCLAVAAFGMAIANTYIYSKDFIKGKNY